MRTIVAAALVLLASGELASACRSLPPVGERGGVHWSYRVDQGRHCWYPDGRPRAHHARRPQPDREERPARKPPPRPPQEPPQTTVADETLGPPPVALARVMIASAALPLDGVFPREEEPAEDAVWPQLETSPEDEELLSSIWPPLPPPDRDHAPTIAIALLAILASAVTLWRRAFNSSWSVGLVPRPYPARIVDTVAFYNHQPRLV